MKELICIVCPKGCHLKVDEENGCSVTGNSCPRGAEYGKMELTHPTRVVTSTVRCQGGLYPRCPVKTDRAVPKELVFDVMKEKNPACYQLVTELFQAQSHTEVPMAQFLAAARDAKLFIRTGELRPASNLLLTSASGTQRAAELYNVTMD